MNARPSSRLFIMLAVLTYLMSVLLFLEQDMRTGIIFDGIGTMFIVFAIAMRHRRVF